MKILLSLISVITLFGCSVGQLAPESERQAEYISDTKGAKTVLYQRALAHFAKVFGDANSALKLRDEASNRIVAHAHVSCNAIKPDLMMAMYEAVFTVDFQAKDNRTRLLIEDVHMSYGAEGLNSPAASGYGQISSSAEMSKVKAECLDPINSALLTALQSDTKSSNW